MDYLCTIKIYVFTKKKQFLIRIILSSIINLIIIGIFITGLMISTLYGQLVLKADVKHLVQPTA